MECAIFHTVKEVGEKNRYFNENLNKKKMLKRTRLT